jgi:peptidoglycan/LPS O-acetylase OafA/YrhL
MADATHPARSRAYEPALDGLRGVAVALVLLFHGGFFWMTGGYVGVSVFFTLSGFLITRLLLDEHRTTGRLSLRGFYVRRVRRLVPASLFCLVAVSLAASFGEFGGLPHVRRDVLAALFQVANWNALASGRSYADLVATAAGQLGPVDHFWSLSVEEQFYWVWPLVCAALMAGGRSLIAVRRWLLVLAVAGIGAAPLVAGVWGANAAYWATPARLGEILAGAGLAALLVDKPAAGVSPVSRLLSSRLVPWLGAAGLAVIVWATVSWPSGSGPAYRGWLGVFALASAAVILALQVRGPLRRAFSWRPLVHLGRISYGVYLYHWPVFAMLTRGRLGIEGWSLFALRMVVTLALAEVSYTLLEQPVRSGTARPSRVGWLAAASVAAVAAMAMAVVPAPVPVFSGGAQVPATFAPVPSSSPSTSAPSTSAPSTSAPATSIPSSSIPSTVVGGTAAGPTSTVRNDTSSTPVTSTTSEPAPPVAALMLGDSTAVALVDGLFKWAYSRPDQLQVASLARLGCGLVRNSFMWGDDTGVYSSNCEHGFTVELPALLRQRVPDVVMLMVTIPDVLGRVWSADEGALLPSDPRYAQRLAADYEVVAQQLLTAGVRHILWVVPPLPSDRWPQAKVNPIRPADWAVFVRTIEQRATAHPREVQVVRLDQWMLQHEPDGVWRPDGLHLTIDGAEAVSDRFIGPLLITTARG